MQKFENNQSWVLGEGAIYVLVDQIHNPGEFVYVGSSTRDKHYPLVTIQSGMNRKYNYKWVASSYTELEAHFFTYGNITNYPIVQSYMAGKSKEEQIMAFIEAIEAEIVYAIRSKTGRWPRYQNEIHFHYPLSQDPKIIAEINQTKQLLGL